MISPAFQIYLPVVASGEKTLRALASEKNIVIGSASDAGFFSDSRYGPLLANEFNLVTPETALCWCYSHPRSCEYDFTRIDALVRYIRPSSIGLHVGSLLWWGMLPEWIKTAPSYEIENILKDHIITVINYLDGQVYSWEIANECFSAYDGSLLDNTFTRGNNIHILYSAYEQARATIREGLLCYNDVWGSDAHRRAILDFAKSVPVDLVGLQMHLSLQTQGEFPLYKLQAFIEELGTSGIRFRITELDIRLLLPSTDVSRERQAKLYYDLVSTCLKYTNCDGIGVWGLSYANSWLPGYYPGFGDALLFDNAYKPTRAYYAVRDALEGAPYGSRI